MALSVVVLAAGKGKRMASNVPKVMHTLAGIPLLERVVDAASQLNPAQMQVVYGNGRGIVKDHFKALPVDWINQEEQLGTGHAVLQALPSIDDNDQVLVLYGDVPLVSSKTLQSLVDKTPKDGVGVLVAKFKDPAGFGRIIRNPRGQIIEIVEHKDADASHLKIQEVNTGIILCPANLLKSWLPQLKSHNKQGEYYLTDIIAMAVSHKVPIADVVAPCEAEVQGVNDLWQLTQLERKYQQRKARQLSLAGVRVTDPARIDIRGRDVNIASDVTLGVNVIIEGPVTIGSHTRVGANCIIKDSVIADNVELLPNSILEGATIAPGCSVGPFARLRPGAELHQEAKVGNFVEMKKSVLGAGSKASHLTYLGDAMIGKKVNIGAGTITCNYDGVNKWQTVIKDGAFIGSNTSLVAPLTIGEDATIGAGSTISDNADDNQLTLARARQKSITGWKRPTKKT